MSDLQLTPEQEGEAEALFARLKSAFEQEAWQMARWLAGKEDRQLLGGTEFEIRERVHRLGAQVVESVLRERKKKATAGRGWAVRTVRSRPGL
jgi:hypothetical protein